MYGGEFISFKKNLSELQHDHPDGLYANLELVSFHSVSKGMIRECGHRGGFMELVELDKVVQDQINKFMSIMLCPPVIGQCCVELMVNLPKKGDPSWEIYNQEIKNIADRLYDRAMFLYNTFKHIEGVEVGKPRVSGDSSARGHC